MADHGFTVTLSLSEGYAFEADFGLAGVPPLVVDEPRPLGEGEGPNAARLLATAIGNCLAASLLFCLRKSRVSVRALRVTVEGDVVRNERGRLRLGPIGVRLEPEVAPEDRHRVGRCLELYEDFCLVTQSVREGLEVAVTVDQSLAAPAIPSGAGAGHDAGA